MKRAAGTQVDAMTVVSGIVPLISDREEGLELLARVASGSASALASVYDAHAERVYAFARRLVGDDAAAEDLVHDVFLALPAAAGRYRGDASVRTFLLSIAQNHSRHHVRAAARRRAALARLEDEPHATTSPPDREAERRQLAKRLQRALDALPLDQRIAFVLCEVEEQTSGEAAVIVGAPEGTVRTRLFHAKKKLREALEEEKS